MQVIGLYIFLTAFFFCYSVLATLEIKDPIKVDSKMYTAIDEPNGLEIQDMIQCQTDKDHATFILTTNGKLYTMRDKELTIGHYANFTTISQMTYNGEKGTFIILSEKLSGGVIPIVDCKVNISNSVPTAAGNQDQNSLSTSDRYVYSKGMFFIGIKLIDKCGLASRYTNMACYEDPTTKDCKLQLYYTYDNDGTHWYSLAKNVFSYDLVKIKDNRNPSIVLMAYEGMNRNSYIAFFSDIRKTNEHKKLASFVHDYYIINNRYLYVIKQSQMTDDESVLKYDLLFPDRLNDVIKFQYARTISKSIDLIFLQYIQQTFSTFMIALNEKEGSNRETAVLYTSNKNGTKFTISLEDVNLIDEEFADIYRPKSMMFGLLANKRIQHNDEDNSQSRMQKFNKKNQFTLTSSKTNIQTMISLSNGGTWHRLRVVDENNKLIECDTENENNQRCYLNLFLEQSFSGLLKAPQITCFLFNGAGIIIGNGNQGKSLSTRIENDYNTYITVDGGVKWKRLLEGPNLIRVIEELGMLILIPYSQYTDKIYTSFDLGQKKLDQFQFSSSKLYAIESVMSDDVHPYILYLYGKTHEDKYQLIVIDLQTILQGSYKECRSIKGKDLVTSDYEFFYPKDINVNKAQQDAQDETSIDSSLGKPQTQQLQPEALDTPFYDEKCYMGSIFGYLRKKPDTQCYINMSKESVFNEMQKMLYQAPRRCECRDEDYECDEGFERLESESLTCYPIDHMKKQISNAESSCIFGEYFYIPSGYRLIPGNTCYDGLEKDKDKKVYCAEGMKDNTLRFIVNCAIFAVFCYVIFLLLWIYKDEVDAFKDVCKNKFKDMKIKISQRYLNQGASDLSASSSLKSDDKSLKEKELKESKRYDAQKQSKKKQKGKKQPKSDLKKKFDNDESIDDDDAAEDLEKESKSLIKK